MVIWYYGFIVLENYSERRLSVGLDVAARTAWDETVSNAIANAPKPASAKIHQPTSMR